MFFVNGANSTGVVVSEQPSVEDALAKAAEFMQGGMSRVGIFSNDGTELTEKELDLLVEIERAEHNRALKG